MPLYWHLLKAVPSLQIITHRIVWSTLLVVGWLLWRHGRGWLRQTLQQPRAAWMLALSGLFIALNWGLYIWAVNAGHVIETSLGYFINPLLNVVLGVAVLGERLNRAQWVSIAIATSGVLWLTFNYGNFPWIALALACSFGIYGLIRKLVAVPPVRGLGVESLYLFLPALGFLIWSELNGAGGFAASSASGGWGMMAAILLIIGGALSAIPLIAYADAVRRIPFSLVGLMQYIAPTLQLLCGVLVLGEPFGSERMIGFTLIWIALAIFATDGFLRARRRPVVLPAA
ncbi:MAG: EamA family transporter RarD [Xanthomonadales bacterium]|nr:EamA family transporter RarD [Xanthomonadales bacterium]